MNTGMQDGACLESVSLFSRNRTRGSWEADTDALTPTPATRLSSSSSRTPTSRPFSSRKWNSRAVTSALFNRLRLSSSDAGDVHRALGLDAVGTCASPPSVGRGSGWWPTDGGDTPHRSDIPPVDPPSVGQMAARFGIPAHGWREAAVTSRGPARPRGTWIVSAHRPSRIQLPAGYADHERLKRPPVSSLVAAAGAIDPAVTLFERGIEQLFNSGCQRWWKRRWCSGLQCCLPGAGIGAAGSGRPTWRHVRDLEKGSGMFSKSVPCLHVEGREPGVCLVLAVPGQVNLEKGIFWQVSRPQPARMTLPRYRALTSLAAAFCARPPPPL